LRDRNAEIEAAGARVFAIGMGEPWKARALRDELRVPFPLLVDQDRVAYRAAGLRTASVAQLLRPTLWRAARRAKKEGFRQVSSGPHPFQLGGSFLLGPGDVDVFVHRVAKLGTEPPIDELLEATRARVRL
jgi:hypothetical protein